MDEHLPGAHTILWFMSAFLCLWGVSLAWRGVRTRDAWLIGSGLLVQVFAAASGYFGAWTYALVTRGYWRNDFAEGWVTPWRAAGWSALALGVALAVLGYRGDRAKGRQRCPRCWYDLGGVNCEAAATCPECGLASKSESLYRPRRRWKTAALGTFFMLASYAIVAVPHARAGGWVGAVPTWVMIAGAGWIPEPMFSHKVKGATRDYSLQARYRRSNWGWQDWLVQRWALRVARSRHAPCATLARALYFIDRDLALRDAALQRSIHLSIVHGLTCDDPEEQSAASFACSVLTLPVDSGSEYLRPFIPALMNSLDKPRASGVCGHYLASLPPSDEASARTIMALMRNGDRRIERGAAGAMRGVVRTAPALRPLFIDSLAADPGAFAAVGPAFWEAEELDPESCRRLLELARTADDQVAQWAVLALRNAREPEVIPALIEQAETRLTQRTRFVRAVCAMGERVSPHAPRIAGLLHDQDHEVGAAVAMALGQWAANGLDIDFAAQDLAVAARSRHQALRNTASFALERRRAWVESQEAERAANR